MIKLFKVKEKQRAENPNGAAPVKKQSAGELRLHRGILSSQVLKNSMLSGSYWEQLCVNLILFAVNVNRVIPH